MGKGRSIALAFLAACPRVFACSVDEGSSEGRRGAAVETPRDWRFQENFELNRKRGRKKRGFSLSKTIRMTRS